MSRIIIKNLPKNMTSERLNGVFAAKGEITDLQMKYTKSGAFRKFAFVGFKRNVDAKHAIEYFHNTFLDASKIQVEEAKDFVDPEKPRPWSKYSEGSSAFENKQKKLSVKEDNPKERNLEKKKIPKRGLDMGELDNDPDFQEFLEVHKVGVRKQTWGNDAAVSQETDVGQSPDQTEDNKMDGEDTKDEEAVPTETEKSHKKKKKKKKKKRDNDEDEDGKQKQEDGKQEDEFADKDSEVKITEQSGLSDMDYLKSKVVKSDQIKPNIEEESPSPGKKSSKQKKDALLTEVKTTETFDRGGHAVKVCGMGRNYTEEDIVTFFSPLKMKVIRSVTNVNGRRKGIIYVEFLSEEDVSEALNRHEAYMGKRFVKVTRDNFGHKSSVESSKKTQAEDVKVDTAPRWAKQAAELENSDEQIPETGKLFVRNLSYMCKHEDLEQLFSTYGPLTEVHLPVDRLLKKVKGFAFITFMMPEHAVKAFTELDRRNFMGRIMHILPGKEKISKKSEADEGSSFKTQKKTKDKNSSSSSHNWNSLFVGSNAVADALAARYNTTKSAVLDPESKGSLGVRLALGETQIVAETRQFLLDNGVALDSFSQPSAPRSKTVMLVKNLPSGTEAKELTEMFGEFGELGKVLLPPTGVTAIIEFLELSEAKVAFFNLAYTKFHHVPLYLEWAPVGVFQSSDKTEKTKNTTENKKDDAEDAVEDAVDNEDDVDDEDDDAGQKEDIDEFEVDEKVVDKMEDEKMEIGEDAVPEEEDEDEAEPESTLFVKNINFYTEEETLREMFSKCGKVRNVVISKKKDPYQSEELLSMGFGFVEYFKREHAMTALKELQHTQVDDHQLELKISNRTTLQKETKTSRKLASKKKQTSSKIMVRNIPFEATITEIRDLFSTFGEIKFVRLPKKMSGTGTHRGFGFVEFLTRHDAKRAFKALCHSSHLFGRRLVLEWAETDESVDKLRKRTADHYSEGAKVKQLRKSKLMEDLEK